MELRQYRYFVAVAEELSFTRAAERLSIAQPPLSQQIAKMERELGVRLLERDHRSVSLTDVGEAFLSECYLLLEQEKRARDTVAWREGRVTGRLRVGCMPSLMAGVMPGALDRFRQALPEVEVVVEELDDADQLVRLAQQRMDIGLGRLEGEQKGVNVHALGAEPLMLALPQDHRLAERRALNLADLADEDFIMFRRSQAPQVYDAYLGLCMRAGFQMRVGDESAVGDHSMLALVACRRGVAIVPASTAQVKFPRVVYRRMNRPGGAELPISLVWRRRAVPRFTKDFARAVKEQVSSVSHPS